MPIHFGGAVDWDGVADFIDAPDLKDEAFATPEGRFNNAQALQDALELGLAHWRKFDLMREAPQASRTHLRRSSQPGGSACQRAVRCPQLLRRHRASRIWQCDIPGRALPNERNPLANFVTCAAAWRAQPGDSVRQAWIVPRRPQHADRIRSCVVCRCHSQAFA